VTTVGRLNRSFLGDCKVLSAKFAFTHQLTNMREPDVRCRRKGLPTSYFCRLGQPLAFGLSLLSFAESRAADPQQVPESVGIFFVPISEMTMTVHLQRVAQTSNLFRYSLPLLMTS
jgi:hypothetical protein